MVVTKSNTSPDCQVISLLLNSHTLTYQCKFTLLEGGGVGSFYEVRAQSSAIIHELIQKVENQFQN